MGISTQPPNKPIPWSVVALLVVVSVAALFWLVLAFVNLGEAIAHWIQGASEDAMLLLIGAAGNLTRSLMLAPGGYYALARLTGRQPWHFRTEVVPSWLIVTLWMFTLGLGTLVLRFGRGVPLLLPPLSAVAVLLPLWLIARLAMHGLSTGSDLRRWGSLGLGTTVGPFLGGMLEAGVLIALTLMALLLVFFHGGLRESAIQLASQLRSAQTEEAMLRILIPVFTDRRAAFFAILILCVVTPLVEEAIKPVAVWLGSGRIKSLPQGFALGALCGVGFAAFESLMAVAAAGPDWWALVLLRAGTGVMHTANAGMMGWALVSAWREGRFLRLGLIYAGVVAIHGTWNLLALAYGVSTLPPALEGIPLDLDFRAPYALPGLVAIALVMLAVLFFMNRRLHRPPYIALAPVNTPDSDLQV